MKYVYWMIPLLVSLFVVLGSTPVSGDDQGGYFTLSVKLEENGKTADALDALEKITDERAGSYMVLLRKGWLQYSLGKYSQSVNSYRKAVALEPSSVEARLGMMLPLMAKRLWKDVVKQGKKILETAPQNYLARSRLAYAYYSLQQWSQAEGHYKAVLAQYPGDVDMRSGYGWSLFKQGKHEAAKKQFREILRFSPSHEAALEGMRLCP